jgi:RNA polymerase sigma-70 factor (ECF subfamily)
MQTVGPSIPAVTGSHLDAEALYRAHSEFVARFLLKLGASGQDVPDLLQEVFLVAHRRGGFVMGAAKPTTWLAEIAFRVASDRRKKTKRKPEDADTDAIALLPAGSATPSEAAEARQGLDRVQRALDALSSDKRVVFVLFELEGESCDSIAKGLGIPVGTVYSRLHAARREFARVHQQLAAEPTADKPAGARGKAIAGAGA